MVLQHGVHSKQKTKVLHGWVQDELMLELGDDYDFVGQSRESAREAEVPGMYYDKKVDILVSRDEQNLGVISVKFVISNYQQNSINYFEQQVGETANLRRGNIVYGNLFCITNPIRYKKRSGEIGRLERIRDHNIQRYLRLRADYEHIHAPDEMAIGIVDLDDNADNVIGLTDPATLAISDDSRAALSNQLSVELFFRRMALRIELRHISP